MEAEHPRVAVTVLILKDGKVLLGQRKGDTNGIQGMFNAPGGHLEQFESFVECAIRETREEAGIEIENVRFLGVTNVKEFPPRHYAVLSFCADWKSGEPTTCEPDRCEGWGWYELDALPENITPGTANGFIALKTGQSIFDK